MTHTLHPEIEKAIGDLYGDTTNNDFFYTNFFETVLKRLGPYLHMPTDLKDSEQSIPKIDNRPEHLREQPETLDKACWIIGALVKNQIQIIDNQNTLIDYITNALPTTKSNDQ